MMTSNRTMINNSDTYVLCEDGTISDGQENFFAILNSSGIKKYRFKSIENNCSILYPEFNEIWHKSKYF